MRKVIYAGAADAEAASRRHVLREAGLEVIAASAGSDVARLAVARGANLIVSEPGAVDGRELQAALAAHPSTAGIAVLDLGLDPDRLTVQSRTSDLALCVYALLRLNATEQALLESDARFRSVADTAPVLMWSSRPDQLRDYFNEPWLYFTGRSLAQELGEGWAQGLHAEDSDRCLATYRQAFDSRQDFEMECRLRHRDGSYRWVLERGVPRYTPDGIFTGYAGSCIDITERKSGEAERERLLNAQVCLRELAEASERRSALLAEISDLLTASLDYQPALDALASKAVPLLADCCFIDLIGASGKLQRAGRSCGYAKVQDTFDAHATCTAIGDSERDPIRQAAFSGKPLVVEHVTREWMQRDELDPAHRALFEQLGVHGLFVVPLVAYGERLGALTSLLVDPARRFMLADVHLAQAMASRIALSLRNGMLFAEAESARREAEEASRVKDEFLATVSHELRQPVHAIGGWVRLLKTGKLAPEKAAHALEMIRQNVGLQAQIVNDLLDVSAMITGQLYLEVQTITLGPVIAAAIEAVRPVANAKSISLVANVGEPDELLRGDEKRLQQVVWNLLYNAIKFTPREGRVEVALSRAGDYAQITVTDNGPGINAEFLPHVFEHFRQQDSTTTRKHGGLGLGLAIVHRLVELHGGRVHASNVAHGRGAMFIVQLPFASLIVQPVVAVDGSA